MSIQAMNWAREQELFVEPVGRHVLLCLANYADAEGRCAFPSVATLARDTRWSERAVQLRLRRLEAAGLIRRGSASHAAQRIARADRIPVVYDLALPRGAQRAPRTCDGVQLALHGVHIGALRGAQRAPDPSEIRHQPQSTQSVISEWERDFERRFKRRPAKTEAR